MSDASEHLAPLLFYPSLFSCSGLIQKSSLDEVKEKIDKELGMLFNFYQTEHDSKQLYVAFKFLATLTQSDRIMNAGDRKWPYDNVCHLIKHL